MKIEIESSDIMKSLVHYLIVDTDIISFCSDDELKEMYKVIKDNYEARKFF